MKYMKVFVCNRPVMRVKTKIPHYQYYQQNEKCYQTQSFKTSNLRPFVFWAQVPLKNKNLSFSWFTLNFTKTKWQDKQTTLICLYFPTFSGGRNSFWNKCNTLGFISFFHYANVRKRCCLIFSMWYKVCICTAFLKWRVSPSMV